MGRLQTEALPPTVTLPQGPAYPVALPSLPPPPLSSRPLFVPRHCPPGFDPAQFEFQEARSYWPFPSTNDLLGCIWQDSTCSTFGIQPCSLWPSVYGKETSKKTTSWKSSPAPPQFGQHQRPAHGLRLWLRHLGNRISGARYSKLLSAGGHLRHQLGKWGR